MFPIKNRQELKDLEKLALLKNQFEEVRLQHKLGKQNFYKNVKELNEPPTDTIEDTSRDITKLITETSITNNKALENFNGKLLEKMNDRGIMECYLWCPLSKITSIETASQIKKVKVHNSNRVNDLLLHITIPITLYNNLLTFRDTSKDFELKRDLLNIKKIETVT